MMVENKLELKNKLIKDKKELMLTLEKSTDPVEKTYLQKQLDMVNSYIDICIKRNRF